VSGSSSWALALVLTLASCGDKDVVPGAVVESTIVETTASATLGSSLVSATDVIVADTTMTAPSQPVAAAPNAETPTLCEPESSTRDMAGRSVLLRVPVTTQPVPVIVAIHGYKGTPEGIEYYSEITQRIGDAGTIVVYPPGTPLDLGFGWNSGASRFATNDVDDVAYLAAILDEILQMPCADPDRVTVLGESNGGGMALRAVCDQRISGRVNALVLVNPAIDENVLATCGGSVGNVTVLATAGLQDTVVGYNGEREPFLAVETWFRRVSEVLGGCVGTAFDQTAYSDIVDRIAGTDCATCVVLFTVGDGPHTWPGSFEGVGGKTPGSFPFTDVLRTFLDGDSTDCAE
jgi:poly(3-hydroxybutyrate) depolymerase